MESIYDICSDVLNNVFKQAAIDFVYENGVIDFLSMEHHKYDDFFADFETKNIPFNKECYKKLIMAIIFTNAFLSSAFKYHQGIDDASFDSLFFHLQELSIDEIYEMFKNKDESLVDIILEAASFSEKNYIYKYASWLSIKTNGLLKKLLKINPFAILDFNNILYEDSFVILEKIIYLVDICYDKSLTYALNDELGELDNYVDFNSFLLSVLRKKLLETCVNLKIDVSTFFATFFSFIYESLVIFDNTDDGISIIKMLENLSNEALLEKFMQDNNFMRLMIDLFLIYIEYMKKDDLIERRKKFLYKGNIKTFKKINPNFEEELLVLKRKLKETN